LREYGTPYRFRLGGRVVVGSPKLVNAAINSSSIRSLKSVVHLFSSAFRLVAHGLNMCNPGMHAGCVRTESLGLFFAGVTGYVLFKDVLDGAEVTTNHVLSLAALVAALASRHMALPQLKAGRMFWALFLGVLFVGSTSYIVVMSGARNAKTAATEAVAIAQNNADRALVESERRKLCSTNSARLWRANAPRKWLGDKRVGFAIQY
jgi:hypothetical protein